MEYAGLKYVDQVVSDTSLLSNEEIRELQASFNVNLHDEDDYLDDLEDDMESFGMHEVTGMSIFGYCA